MRTPSSASSRLPFTVRVCALLASLGALGLVGCKQDVGERCEQPSDCASGYCGNSNAPIGTTSATAQTCTPGPGTPMVIDAGRTPDGATGAADAATDATDAATDATDGATDASDAGDAASEAPHDAASDLPTEGGTDGGLDGADAGTGEAGGDTGAADAGSDALEAGSAG